MMKYKLLSSVYYQNLNDYQKLYTERFGSESAYLIPDISIHNHPAFFIMLPEFSKTIEDIYHCNVEINQEFRHIPKKAIEKFSNESLVDEIIITNNIEGVHSSRKDINKIIYETSKKIRPFEGLVKKYQLLLNHKNINLNSCEDIRSLYDDIVLNEIEDDSRPDGQIFRKEFVSVYTVTDKEKHRGTYPESKIISEITALLNFMNSDDDIARLIKIAIFHYVFGYIHPFYDGNGRTNRIISSYYINKAVGSTFTGLSLAYTIQENKKEYYKAFDNCNNPKCKGDLTPFVDMFLNIIKKSSENIHSKIISASQKLSHYKNSLEIFSLIKGLTDLQTDCLFLLVQNQLFRSEGLPTKEMAEYLKKSENTTRNVLKSLFSLDFVEIEMHTIGNKNFYNINLDVLDTAFENIFRGDDQ